MKDTQLHKPSCFGILELVFPKGENGLRNSPEKCMKCICKTQCLRAAMKNESGLEFQEERIDRAYEEKRIGLIERWSKKKFLHQKRKKR